MLVVGKFLKTYGIKGQIKVKSFLTDKKNIKKFKKFYIKEKKLIELVFIRKINENFICEIDQLDSTNEIKKFVGELIYAEKDELPKLKKNNFYFFELIGLNIKIKNKTIGKVLTINNHGAGNYLEIKNNEKKELLLVPYNKFHIKLINMKEKYIKLNELYYSDEV